MLFRNLEYIRTNIRFFTIALFCISLCLAAIIEYSLGPNMQEIVQLVDSDNVGDTDFEEDIELDNEVEKIVYLYRLSLFENGPTNFYDTSTPFYSLYARIQLPPPEELKA